MGHKVQINCNNWNRSEEQSLTGFKEATKKEKKAQEKLDIRRHAKDGVDHT